MFADRLYISPHYNPEDYTILNLRVDSPEKDWNRAIDIFQDRIYGRFFNAIDILLNETRRFPTDGIDFSFSAMALMCLLIETLHQFYNGIDETEWRRHKDAFINFLTGSTRFQPHFGVREAQLFYSHIRNGIIHQAQTKRNTQLTISSTRMVDIIPRGIRIDVMLFYTVLRDEVYDYINRLHNPDEHSIRERFISKMNYIVRDTLN